MTLLAFLFAAVILAAAQAADPAVSTATEEARAALEVRGAEDIDADIAAERQAWD